MSIPEILSTPFLSSILVRSLVVGLLTALCAALLGVTLVLKRYSMIGDGLSHVGFFALALSTAAGVSAAWSMEASIPIVVVSAVLILLLGRSLLIGGDAACAIVSTGAVAGGANANRAGGRCGRPNCDQRLLVTRWETDGGAHGASHYVTGRTPLDYAQYRDVWLPIIKALG